LSRSEESWFQESLAAFLESATACFPEFDPAWSLAWCCLEMPIQELVKRCSGSATRFRVSELPCPGPEPPFRAWDWTLLAFLPHPASVNSEQFVPAPLCQIVSPFRRQHQQNPPRCQPVQARQR